MNTTANGAAYPHLERRPGSVYRQLFVKGRRVRAEVLYRLTVPKEDGTFFTPEQLAEDFRVPVEAVREAMRYCESDPVDIRFDDRVRELVDARLGFDEPDPAKRPHLTPFERITARRDAERQAARELGLS